MHAVPIAGLAVRARARGTRSHTGRLRPIGESGLRDGKQALLPNLPSCLAVYRCDRTYG